MFLFFAIYAYPLVNIFGSSFCEWNYKNLLHPEFLGWNHIFDNFIRLFTKDTHFKTALINSLKWIGLTAVIQVPFSILVALVLSKKRKGWALTRNVFLIPNIISTAAIGLIFLNLYDPANGLITDLVHLVNPDLPLNILAKPGTAFWGVTFSYILFGGTNCLLLMSQISAIPQELYEAARIDGASDFQADRRITLPLLRPMIGTVLVLACNYGLLLYNELFLLTKGGPDGATYSLSLYVYQTSMGSTKLNFALGNAAGVIQVIIGLVLVISINKLLRTNESDL
ncbi:sugar ABC transporter permease [Lachnospiraceae bacterium ASD3451]|uniref:Sugar ABC transporter permease n=2 Tax=Diplocloster agilis TaxID=2850323 RepID=A0A949K7S4_9FIRM|nr:sugar ABC transporter permease [Diplocloster agilis]MBU9738133.1 sugar ABC transporter permease [Diplocloster agilis]MBU9742609.1 sugar ABC transporter permease [Diplocloster agilis]